MASSSVAVTRLRNCTIHPQWINGLLLEWLQRQVNHRTRTAPGFRWRHASEAAAPAAADGRARRTGSDLRFQPTPVVSTTLLEWIRGSAYTTTQVTHSLMLSSASWTHTGTGPGWCQHAASGMVADSRCAILDRSRTSADLIQFPLNSQNKHPM